MSNRFLTLRGLTLLWGFLLAIPIVKGAPVGADASTANPKAAAMPAGQPASWMPHDMIVSFNNLPERYSCDDLWYKFHDLLLALGARPDLKILAYRCGPGATGRSPQVQLQFSTPRLLTSAQRRWMDVEAAPETVRLGSGNPQSWHKADCELMRQTKDELLNPITSRVVSFDLACAAPPTDKWRYTVTVQALEPVRTPARVAAGERSDSEPSKR
jgi:hypothetical protein